MIYLEHEPCGDLMTVTLVYMISYLIIASMLLLTSLFFYIHEKEKFGIKNVKLLGTTIL